MKKLIVCLTITAFAAMTSLQAGEQCAKDKTACSAQVKTGCSTQAKASCNAAKTVSATKSCCSTAKVAKRDVSVKGATLLVQR